MNIHHVRLILVREYVQRVRNPTFIIGTVLGVLGIAALAFLPAVIDYFDRQNATKIAIVDPNNLIYPYLPKTTGATPTPLPGGAASQSTLPLSSGIQFTRADTVDEKVLSQRVNTGSLTAYLVVEGTRASNATFLYHGKDRPSTVLSARLVGLLSAAATQARLQESGITPQQAETIFASPEFRVQPVVDGTLKDEKTYFQSQFLVYVLLILLYMTMLLYGIQVAMGVVEEKSSRVMELLITAIRPVELMIGKVVGVGLTGLTQYLVWVVVGVVGLLLGSALGNSTLGVSLDLASIPVAMWLYFLLFFVLGYLLFASMYAALGSLVSKTEEVNGITTPITIIMVGVYLFSIWALGNPDAAAVKWLSFVPFLTPMLMFIRVSLSSPAWWEPVLSIVLLIGAIFLFAWIAAKIYRVGVLLYGKRPSFREIGRLLRAT